MSRKNICIHGHFYQPPRENPWLNEVELQESAYPYHDWNDRITAECYSRNAASRILGSDGRIIDIVNNYSRMSFNFGPTLLQWMKKKKPDVYGAILQADKESQKRFSGHGSAIAQAYNHMIMPLGNDRDRWTQVYWGIRDFQEHFKRDPEGMWLPETAVNIPTLEVLAENGIKFTILSPSQAKCVRKMGEKRWKNTEGAKVNPRQPYLCHLPSGQSIVLFFYDAPVAQAIAFEHLLKDGEQFANRLLSAFGSDDTMSSLVHVATDGETYGHHHDFGEMALSYALYQIEQNPDVDLTVYGEYLEKNPPEWEAEILEDTAWSCSHGVGRWKNDCGCSSGQHPEWNQLWREPLRNAFDWLREALAQLYETKMSSYVSDPWDVRNQYVDVILRRDAKVAGGFLKKHANRTLEKDDYSQMLQLLEMSHHAMLMYTSCGWFFDEVTGIETMQDLFYAARAMQLAQNMTGHSFESEFILFLEKVPSNVAEYKNAAEAYRSIVRPAVLDWLRVGGHYAVSSLFSDYPDRIQIFSYMAESDSHKVLEVGKRRLAFGKTKLVSDITWEERLVTFAILHLGEHNLWGGVRDYQDDTAFHKMCEEISRVFEKGDVTRMIQLMDKHFGSHSYSFRHLFRDEQRKIMEHVLDKSRAEVEQALAQVYQNHYPVMQAVRQLGLHLPKALKMTSECIVHTELRKILENDDLDFDALDRTVDGVKNLSVDLDKITLNYLVTRCITRMMEKWCDTPEDTIQMKSMIRFLEKIQVIQLVPNLWRAQNLCFWVAKKMYQQCEAGVDEGDFVRREWCQAFSELLERLYIKLRE